MAGATRGHMVPAPGLSSTGEWGQVEGLLRTRNQTYKAVFLWIPVCLTCLVFLLAFLVTPCQSLCGCLLISLSSPLHFGELQDQFLNPYFFSLYTHYWDNPPTLGALIPPISWSFPISFFQRELPHWTPDTHIRLPTGDWRVWWVSQIVIWPSSKAELISSPPAPFIPSSSFPYVLCPVLSFYFVPCPL